MLLSVEWFKEGFLLYLSRLIVCKKEYKARNFEMWVNLYSKPSHDRPPRIDKPIEIDKNKLSDAVLEKESDTIVNPLYDTKSTPTNDPIPSSKIIPSGPSQLKSIIYPKDSDVVPLVKTPIKLNAQQLALNSLVERAELVKNANHTLTDKNM